MEEKDDSAEQKKSGPFSVAALTSSLLSLLVLPILLAPLGIILGVARIKKERFASAAIGIGIVSLAVMGYHMIKIEKDYQDEMKKNRSRSGDRADAPLKRCGLYSFAS